jgi:anti-sigma factor RsiW
MNCHRITELMDAYLAGELSAERRREFADHLSGCPTCRDSVASLESLLTEARGMRRPVEPASDLWPGVLSRIEPTARRTARSSSRIRRPAVWAPVLAAAAVVLLVVVTGPWLDRTGVEVRRLAGLGPAQAVEQEFVVLIEHLQTEVASTVELSGPANSTLADGLREIEQAIADTRAAVEAHPDDPQLQRRLAASYETKVELLRWTTSFHGGGDVLY